MRPLALALTALATVGLTAGLQACAPSADGEARATAPLPGLTAASTADPSGAGHPLDGTIWDVATGEALEADALAERLRSADIAVLGEIHDNPEHHERQAFLVERLEPAGIAFEMVPEGSEEGVNVFLEQGAAAGEIGPAIGWSRLGWPDWEMYAPVFAAAEDAYVAGGGVARGDLVRAMRNDAAAAFGAGATGYGLSDPLAADARSALVDEMVEAHCGMLPREAAAPMVEAQRLRDARFAAAARRAAEKGEGRAVLITGNGHARTDRGVPDYLAARAPETRVLSLGQVEVAAEGERLGDYDLPYDFVWFSGSPRRGDPCEAFRR